MKPTIQKAKINLRKSPSTSPSLPKRNSKVKPEAEWESQKKSSDPSTKRKASNLNLSPKLPKPNSSSGASFATPSFSKTSTTKTKKPSSAPCKKNSQKKMKPSLLKEKTVTLFSSLNQVSMNVGRSSTVKISFWKLISTVMPSVSWPWCTTLQELLPSRLKPQENFTHWTESLSVKL